MQETALQASVRSLKQQVEAKAGTCLLRACLCWLVVMVWCEVWGSFVLVLLRVSYHGYGKCASMAVRIVLQMCLIYAARHPGAF